jgi:hypothetical protein
VPDSPLFQAHDHGLVHTLEEQSFDAIVGYLKYTGTLDPETLALSVNIYAKIPNLPEIPLGHAEGNLANGVTVQFDNSGVGARGSVEFYKRDGDWKEMWARSKYTFLGQEYKSDFPVLRIQQDDTAPISLQAQSHGLVRIQGEVPFSKRVGPLQYTGTVDPSTLALSVDVYLQSSRTLLGRADGNLKDGVKLPLKTRHGSTGIEKTIGLVGFSVRWGNQVWGVWAKSRLLLDGERYIEDVKLFDIPWRVQAQQHTIDSAKSFDIKAWPLQYTGTLDTNTLTVSVDVYFETSYKSKKLLGHTNGNLDDEVEFTFSEEGIAEGRVLFYIRHGTTWGAMFAKSTVILDGQVHSTDGPVLNIPWPAKVQESHSKQHPISTLDIASFDTIVGPLQYTGIFDTETHTLSIDVDVLEVPDNIHLGTEEGPLRHSGGVLVEFDRLGVAAGKVLFYEKDGEIWAMARFTLYGEPYRSNVPVWVIPDN